MKITYGTLTWHRRERGRRYVSTCGRYEIHRRDYWWTWIDIRKGTTIADGGMSRSLCRAMQQANERVKREGL